MFLLPPRLFLLHLRQLFPYGVFASDVINRKSLICYLVKWNNISRNVSNVGCYLSYFGTIWSGFSTNTVFKNNSVYFSFLYFFIYVGDSNSYFLCMGLKLALGTASIYWRWFIYILHLVLIKLLSYSLIINMYNLIEWCKFNFMIYSNAKYFIEWG